MRFLTLCQGNCKYIFCGLFRVILGKTNVLCRIFSFSSSFEITSLAWVVNAVSTTSKSSSSSTTLFRYFEIFMVFGTTGITFLLLHFKKCHWIRDSSLTFSQLQSEHTCFSQLKNAQFPRFCWAKNSIFLGSRPHLRWFAKNASKHSAMNVSLTSPGCSLLRWSPFRRYSLKCLSNSVSDLLHFARYEPSSLIEAYIAFVSCWDDGSAGILCWALRPHLVASSPLAKHLNLALSSLSFGLAIKASWFIPFISLYRALYSSPSSFLTSSIVNASNLLLI